MGKVKVLIPVFGTSFASDDTTTSCSDALVTTKRLLLILEKEAILNSVMKFLLVIVVDNTAITGGEIVTRLEVVTAKVGEGLMFVLDPV